MEGRLRGEGLRNAVGATAQIAGAISQLSQLKGASRGGDGGYGTPPTTTTGGYGQPGQANAYGPTTTGVGFEQPGQQAAYGPLAAGGGYGQTVLKYQRGPERDRYLATLERMRPQDGSADMIQYFEGVHREAGPRSHKGPSFLPWHRAFLLHFERQLQAIDPSVSLPYWDWTSDVSQVLAGDFLGDSTQEVVEFDGLNPIRNWTSGNQRIHRKPGVQGIYMGAQDPRVENAFQQSTYGPYPQGFGVELEQRLHDDGHTWVGGNQGWMAVVAEPAVRHFAAARS